MGYPKDLIMSILTQDGLAELSKAIGSITASDLERAGFSIPDKEHMREIEDNLSLAAGRIKRCEDYLD